MSDTPLLSIRPEFSIPIPNYSDIQDDFDKSSKGSSKPITDSKSPPNTSQILSQLSSRSQSPPQTPCLAHSSTKDEKPSFNYDLELFNHCKKYLDTKNHHGLALIARQKGVPPFLRFKIWPLLLKYHPFVLNPFIQPDNDINEDDASDTKTSERASDEDPNTAANAIDDSASDTTKPSASTEQKSSTSKSDEIKSRIKKDLRKYVQRLKYSTSNINLSGVELKMFEILENSILKFTKKWGKIIKYDQSLTWIALNLAEWFPPVQNTPWVLVGRDNTSQNNAVVVNFLDDYSNYIDNIPDLKEYLEGLIDDKSFVNMSFHDVYERLVLVLLHSPEERNRSNSKQRSESSSSGSGSKSNSKSGSDASTHVNAALLSRSSSSTSSTSSRSSFSSTRNILSAPKKVNKTVLPTSGGTIEERVSFFMYCLRKVLPELSDYFHEEQILNKFGSNDDEWLIWWLNYCGSKVWSKVDRGRIWDSLLGWRLKNNKKDMNYYVEKLQIDSNDNLNKFLQKLGPDIFWSLSSIDDFGSSSAGQGEGSNQSKDDDLFQETDRRNSFKDLVEELNNRTREGSDSSTNKDHQVVEKQSETTRSLNRITIPFSQIDAHIELIFISIAFLKSKENILVELDQHEIRQFLSRLPSKSYKYKQRKQQGESNNTHSNATTNAGSTPTSLSIPSSPSNSSSPIINDELSAYSSSSATPYNGTENEDNDIIISNDSVYNHKVDFMNNIINEAGELWRKWLWLEMVDDS